MFYFKDSIYFSGAKSKGGELIGINFYADIYKNNGEIQLCYSSFGDHLYHLFRLKKDKEVYLLIRFFTKKWDEEKSTEYDAEVAGTKREEAIEYAVKMIMERVPDAPILEIDPLEMEIELRKKLKEYDNKIFV